MSFTTTIQALFEFLTSHDAGWSVASVSFLATFLCFFLVYLLLEPSRHRRLLLSYTVAFSLFFAYKANGLLMLLLPTTTLLSWGLTRWMARQTDLKWRRGLLTLTIALTLLPLAYFKYSGLFVSSLHAMMGENLPLGKLFMPLGISFYSFQAVSYAVGYDWIFNTIRKKLWICYLIENNCINLHCYIISCNNRLWFEISNLLF